MPTSNASSISNVLISPFPLNLLGTKRITISSQSLATVALNSMNNKTQTQSILATVYINEPVYGLVTHSNTTNVNHLLKVKNIDSIDLQMCDEDGNFINFNNQEFTMKLLISSTHELIIGSKSTFGQITQQTTVQEKSSPSPIIEETVDIVVSLLIGSRSPPASCEKHCAPSGNSTRNQKFRAGDW